MPKAVSILFGAGFTLACAWALGRMALKRAGWKGAREEEHLLALMCGAALLSGFVFVLGVLHAVYDAALLAAGALILGAAWKDGAFRRREAGRLEPLPRRWAWLFWTVYAAYAAAAALTAMAPEISPDGSAYHLGVVGRYYRAHGMEPVTTNMYAALSQGLEMLFLWAYAFGRHSAAAVVHCAFYLALPVLMVRYGQRAGAPAAGAAAALFVLCAPVALVDGTSAYNDAAVACVAFAVFYLVETEAPPVLAGLLAGFSYGLKYTAFVALAYALLRYAGKRKWKAMVPLCAAAAAMAGPWGLRNWVFYGNPASPLLNAVWPNPYVHVSFEQDYVEMMRRYPGVESWRQLPLELTVKGELLGGFWGPLFLVAPAGLLAARLPLGRRMILAAALWAGPYFTNTGARFLMPVAPFASYAMALALPAPVLGGLAAAHAVLSFPDMPRRYMKKPGWRVSKIPWKAALRLEEETLWLGRQSAGYQAARMIEALTPADALVLTMNSIPESYTTREVAVGFQSARGERLLDQLQTALPADYRPGVEWVFRFPRQSLTAVRVVQTNTPARWSPQSKDLWSVHEMRIYAAGREAVRKPRWRITARPDPWDAWLAFDNSALTRWRCWERIHAGMFLEADFGRAEEADEVTMLMSRDQHGVRMRAEGRTAAGRWTVLDSEPEGRAFAPPLALRRQAAGALKKEGVTHLLIREGDFGWEDFRKNAGAWRIREIGAVDGYRLYRLE